LNEEVDFKFRILFYQLPVN